MNAAALRAFDNAEPAGWGIADMSILQPGRSRPVPMPGEIFGDLWPLIGDLAMGAGSPVDYVALSVLGVAASLIGAKRRVQPFSTSPQWREPAILWLAPVGDPSSNKSPAIDAAIEPLKGMEAELAELHKSTLLAFQAVAERARAERKEWEGQVKTATKEGLATPPLPVAADDPDEPQRPRLVVQDATPEALGVILAGNPNGTLHLRDELAGWLMSFERYTPGGREFWLEAYGGRPHVIDRKGVAKPLSIPFNGVTVLGGIQPEKLADCLLDSTDDGLVARFLWAWPDPVPYHRPRSVADRGRLERVYRRLLSLTTGQDGACVTLHLSDDAADLFERWIQDTAAGAGDTSGLYKGFCGKNRGLALRLALVVELLAWADCGGPEPAAVDVRTLAAVLAFIEDYAKPTALRVFGDAALPKAERSAVAVARYIRRKKPRTVNGRELRRDSSLPMLKTAEDVDEALEALVEAGWVRKPAERVDAAGGRPRKDYLVNPQVVGL